MKLLCFGDSNTYGYDPRSYFGDRYPENERWVNLLADMLGCDAVNAGENGREIPRNSWELREFDRLLHREAPVDLLTVMLGSNDLLQGNSLETIEKRMEDFLRRVDLEPKQILLIAPPPMKAGEWTTAPGLIEDSMGLSQTYESLASRLGVGFADAGKWNIPLAFDGVHLTLEGHRALAEGLYHIVNKGE